MATDAQSLLDASKCYACYSNDPYALTLMKLALLQQLVLALKPMADTSASTLLSQANCYTCYGSNLYTLTAMELALLAQLIGAISGGGGGGGGPSGILSSGAGAPAGDPGVANALYTDTNTGILYAFYGGAWH